MKLQDIGEKIRERRVQEGIKQGDLAARAKVYQSDLSALENGKSRIQNFDTLSAIVESLGLEFALVEKTA